MMLKNTMDDLLDISMIPSVDKNNITQMKEDINLDEILINKTLDDEDEDDDQDIHNLIETLGKGDEKQIKKANQNITKIEQSFKFTPHYEPKNKNEVISTNNLNYEKKDLKPILKDFFWKAYDIISHKNAEQIIDDEDDDDDDIEDIVKAKQKLLKIIDELIIENKEGKCKMKLNFEEKKLKIIGNYFIINLDAIHTINKFNKMLIIKIIFEIEIKMYIRSGNVKIYFSKYSLNYNKDKQEISFNPNLKYLLINNNLGIYSITYCTCGECMVCKNAKNPKPFNDLLIYLRRENKIVYKPEYSQLWFGKYNKYRNESNYKCSFCKDFYKNKLNIVKLYCVEDEDHSCQFWICLVCFLRMSKKKFPVQCPNCGFFLINFSKLRSIFRLKHARLNQK